MRRVTWLHESKAEGPAEAARDAFLHMSPREGDLSLHVHDDESGAEHRVVLDALSGEVSDTVSIGWSPTAVWLRSLARESGDDCRLTGCLEVSFGPHKYMQHVVAIPVIQAYECPSCGHVTQESALSAEVKTIGRIGTEKVLGGCAKCQKPLTDLDAEQVPDGDDHGCLEDLYVFESPGKSFTTTKLPGFEGDYVVYFVL